MTTAATQAGERENEDVALVPFARAHLEGALKLSQEMSWPYLLKDWEFALQLGRGFVVTSAGAVVGTALWWPYGDTHASAGMIIVSKAVQGRGYGARLMDALLAAARPRIITLNSTAEGMALYQRRGFVPIGVIHQHHGIPRERHEAPRSVLRQGNGSIGFRGDRGSRSRGHRLDEARDAEPADRGRRRLCPLA